MARFPWIKLWPDRLLASARWRRVTIYEAGTYLQILLRVDGDGALRTGATPWTVDDLAYDLGISKRRCKRLQAAVDRLLRLDLLARSDEDGALCISRFDALQRRSNASQAGEVGKLAKELGRQTRI